MGIKSISLAATMFVLSTGVNATIMNSLNGINYEWLELSATTGMSRDQVEADIAAANLGDTLFGYQYASRSLVEELLWSYSTFDGINGWHAESELVNGMNDLLTDFGITSTSTYPLGSFNDVHCVEMFTDSDIKSQGMYGLEDECYRHLGQTCRAVFTVNLYQGVSTGAFTGDSLGWDSTHSNPVNFWDDVGSQYVGSYLVKVSAVPVPAAVWLFGSGLLGLIGAARRKA
mgnify:CR=1 FL=1